ncbi:MAG: organomercurial lyase [Longimicrobiales bacterium]
MTFDRVAGRVRAAVYRLTAETTRVPAAGRVAMEVDLGLDTVRAALRHLEDAHELGLNADRTEVRIANPFSAVETPFPVVTERGTYRANCAWDALGVSAILGTDGWTETTCPGSEAPLAFGVRDGALAGDVDAVVHMVVPLRDAWQDIGFT